MIDLCILILLLLASFALSAWVLAVSARAVGSPRARYRHGALAAGLMVVCGVAVGIAWGITAAHGAMVFVSALLVGMNYLAAYWICRRVFRLSAAKALVPWGANIALGIVEVILAVVLLRPFVMEAFIVPTGSMTPTIDPGNRVMVGKVLRPGRWDIVAYRTNFQGPAIYCKRVIGLPGERLRFEGGNLYVNDKRVEPPALLAGRFRLPDTGRSFPPYPVHYQEGQTITLGKNEFFFIGDNADVSLDSRLLGPSDRSALVGVADLMYWPLSRFHILR